jgi:DNA (cytosine-5)-methyltransferase 1
MRQGEGRPFRARGADAHPNRLRRARRKAPRVPGIDKPLGTVVAGGAKHALVSAFLAKHYGGHEATGTRMGQPVDTITTQDHHSLVTSHLVKLRGTCKDGQRSDAPVPTLSAQGTHVGEVRAFLTRYNGSSTGQRLDIPASTIDTTDRLGLVTVMGADYVIADILLRMLKPRELFNAHGFPPTTSSTAMGKASLSRSASRSAWSATACRRRSPPRSSERTWRPAQEREFALAGD